MQLAQSYLKLTVFCIPVFDSLLKKFESVYSVLQKCQTIERQNDPCGFVARRIRRIYMHNIPWY